MYSIVLYYIHRREIQASIRKVKTMTTLQNYHPMIIGENAATHQIVCTDGQIRQCRVEQFVEGWFAYLIKDGQTWTKRTAYKTVRKALNAAAKW